jgi:hypothetical protein
MTEWDLDGYSIDPQRDGGINNDGFKIWRNDGKIGYVHLAYAVIITSLQDLFFGTPEDVLSAAVFFESDNPEESSYHLWLRVLGMERAALQQVIEYHKLGITPRSDWFRKVDRLFKYMMMYG